MIYKSRIRILCKEDDNSRAQADFYKTMTANYNTEFGEQQNIMSSLLTKLQPIVAAGAGQYGYDTTEDASLRSTATDTDAKAFSDQGVKLDNQMAAQNGGVDGAVPTGAKEQLKQQLGVEQAKKISSDQQAITQAGYDKGATDYNNAVAGEENVMTQVNPSSAANAVSSAGDAATGAEKAANESANGWMTLAGTALGGAASIGAKFIKP
jgi:hypothetical protein